MRIKRSQFQTFINTTPLAVPTYILLGKGATSAKEAMNPKTTSETYITDNAATITVDSYAPTMPVKLTAFSGEPVFEYLRTFKENNLILSDAETDIVNVDLFETPTTGAYPARKHFVSIQIDDFGDEGGVRMQMTFTLNFQGPPVAGTFNPTTLAFT